MTIVELAFEGGSSKGSSGDFASEVESFFFFLAADFASETELLILLNGQRKDLGSKCPSLPQPL
eukprot:15331777-Ditylum_brightwellii.AAC.1